MTVSEEKDSCRKLLDILASFAVYCVKKGQLYGEFEDYRRYVNGQLQKSGLAPLSGLDNYSSNLNAIDKLVDAYAVLKRNKSKAHGAVLWKLGQVSLPHDADYFRLSRPERGKAEHRFRKQMTELLLSLDLDLSSRDKVNFLDFMNYKYSDDFSQRLYDRFASYKIEDEYTATHTVKLLMKTLEASKKEKSFARLRKARKLFENAAANSAYLENSGYTDKDGNIEGVRGKIYILDGKTREDIGRRLQKSKIAFDSSCREFFADNERFDTDVLKTMAIVVNRISAPGSASGKKNLLERYWRDVNAAVSREDTKMNGRDVENYIRYLCSYAVFHPEAKDIDMRPLRTVLEKNSAPAVMFRLFEDQKTVKQDGANINKKSVLKAADIYVRSFASTLPEAEEFNPHFYKGMTEMFASIVTECGYNKKEVRQLCEHIISVPNCPKELCEMRKEVMTAYTYPQYFAAKNRLKVAAI